MAAPPGGAAPGRPMREESAERHPPPPAPRDIREGLIARGLAAPGDSWEPLSGGHSNRIWKVGKGPSALICKLYAPHVHSELFPNDSRAEWAALTGLRGQGLAPEPLALVETGSGPCLVYRHIPGTPWRTGPDRVARLLARLHRLPPPQGLRRAAAGEAALAAQTERMLDTLPPAEAARLHALRPPPAPAAEGEPVPEVFLHGDVVPANIICTRRGIALIDWQCPALGDPCEDLSTFLSPAMQALYGRKPLTPAEEEAFLAAYAAPGVTVRLRRLRPWYHWRMAAYCLWRAGRGGTGHAAVAGLEVAALERALSAPAPLSRAGA